MHYCVNVIFMMKFCLNWCGAALLSMLLLCTSCGDADLFDTDKWTNEIEGWEPGVSLKVLHGSFTLWDLINQGDDDVVVKEGNDLIIQYTEEGIYHIDIGQVFDMPAEDVRVILSAGDKFHRVVKIPVICHIKRQSVKLRVKRFRKHKDGFYLFQFFSCALPKRRRDKACDIAAETVNIRFLYPEL